MNFSERREVCFKHFNEQKAETEKRCQESIEANRKGNLKVTFKDASGNPVSGNVKITQKSHDFKYGANIFMLDELPTEAENKAFRELFKKYFNLATVPFYWGDLEPEQGKPRYDKNSYKIYRRPAPDLCVEYCEENGIIPKLHCLFYEQFLPNWLPKQNAEEMRKLYEKRFAEIAERYKGKMYEFEVSNETLLAHDWPQRTVLSDERDCIEWAFSLARKYFDGEKLVINDANYLPEIAAEGYRHKYVLQLDKLLKNKTPIDKIGIQNHLFIGVWQKDGELAPDEEIVDYSDKYMNPANYFKALDMLAEYGLPLELTEVTIPTIEESTEAEELQADLLENLYTIWFSHPAVENIVYWNTVDYAAFVKPGSEWNENNCRGGLFHRDLTPKKSAERLWWLFNKKWHTEVEEALENGTVDFRGFYGEYEAEVNGKKYSFGLHKGEAENVEIIL